MNLPPLSPMEESYISSVGEGGGEIMADIPPMLPSLENFELKTWRTKFPEDWGGNHFGWPHNPIDGLPEMKQNRG